MRTTVDLDAAVLDRAKRLALSEGRTLGALLSEALEAYLSKREGAEKDGPFDLLVRGKPGGRFLSPAEVDAIEQDEEGPRHPPR